MQFQAHMFTTMEDLAASLPYGGMSFILRPQQKTEVLVRVRGGLSFEHKPIQKAFEKGHVRASFELIEITQHLLADLPQPKEDTVLDIEGISNCSPSEPTQGTASLLLKIDVCYVPV